MGEGLAVLGIEEAEVMDRDNRIYFTDRLTSQMIKVKLDDKLKNNYDDEYTEGTKHRTHIKRVCVKDDERHSLTQQVAGVADVDGRLLLVSRQHPNMDAGLQECCYGLWHL